MEKPAKVEVGQRWRVTRGDITLNGVIVETDATHATIEWIMAGGSAPWKTRWPFQSVHDDSAMTFLGYGPQQGAGPEAGQACTCMYGPCDCAAAPKPAPEVAPLVYHKTPATVAPHAGEMRDAMTGVAMTALEAIRSRKPPAPWVPSVDEWDLLPDAGR